jgi:HlyD family secretion protein
VPKIVTRLLVSAVVIAAVAYGVYRWTQRPPAVVRVEPVARGTVEHVVANTRAGTIRAERRSRLAPAVPGRVVRMPVHEGDRVEEGATLLELWSKDVRAELELARAEALRAEAQHEEACQRAALAEREEERARELHETGIRSPEQYDRIASEAVAMRAACKAAEAGAEMQRARIKTLEAQLEQLELHAPFAGVVAEVNAELGEFVTPSPVGIPTPPAVDLFDPSSLYVEAPLDEVDAPDVRPGMPVRITLDAFRGEAFAGRVLRVAPFVLELEKQARTVAVDVAFEDPAIQQRLLPGYSADIEVVLEVREDVLRIPTEALFGDDHVYVLDEAVGVVREVAVTCGLRSWTHTEVTGGLAPGALLVVDLDRSALTDGAAARRAEGAEGENGDRGP